MVIAVGWLTYLFGARARSGDTLGTAKHRLLGPSEGLGQADLYLPVVVAAFTSGQRLELRGLIEVSGRWPTLPRRLFDKKVTS